MLIFFAILSFLSVVGAIALLRKLQFWLYKPVQTELYLGAVLQSAQTAENTVRSLLARIQWMELGTPVHLMLVDKSGEPETHQIVNKIIAKFPGIALLSQEEIKYNKEE